MQTQTLFNLKSYNNHTNNSKLLNVINHSIDLFCSSIGFQKSYFSKFLPYSETQTLKFLNPNNFEKRLKVTDLELILLNLDKPHRKIILDSLCQANGFICVDESSQNNKYSSLDNLLLQITATNGNLAKSFLYSMRDGNINKDEQKQLLDIAYSLREFLITFENRIIETNK